MTSTQTPTHIGFPKPLLGEQPVRLPIYWNSELGFALEKPSGVQVITDNWYPRVPVLTEALNYQASQEKGELQRLGVARSGAKAIFQCEPDLAGLALFAKDPATADFWTNAYGSYEFEIKVHLLVVRAPADLETCECDLPLARHGQEKEVLVSHRTGKKTLTRFQRLQSRGKYSIWEATVDYLRIHQIQLHAYEVGLPIVGEMQYARESEVYFSQLKRSYVPKGNDPERPIHAGPAMFISTLTIPLPSGEKVTIQRPAPKHFTVLLKALARHGRA